VSRPFREAGYHTAWVGKWHLDGSNSRDHYIPPERRGEFDYWMGYENNNNQNECYLFGSDDESPRRLPGYEVDSLTDVLLDHLAAHVKLGRSSAQSAAAPKSDGPRPGVAAETAPGQEPGTGGDAREGAYQPFFAVLSVQPPHDPYVAPTNPVYQPTPHTPASVTLRANVPHVDWMREDARMHYAGYLNMVENIDYNVGRIVERLKELDVDRETYVVFFSDHGDMLWSHGQRGKSSPWEEAIRIPLVVSRVGGSQNMKSGRTDAVVNHVDIAPTTLGLCGIEPPTWMNGHDYSSLCVRADSPEHRPAAQESDKAAPESAYLQQIPRKMHAHSVHRAWRGVVTRDGWKYVCTPANDWLLFNTSADPFEEANLVYDRAFQSEKERCHALLRAWIETTGDEFAMPDISLPG
jgi:arylsulfatase A-like enzyme